MHPLSRPELAVGENVDGLVAFFSNPLNSSHPRWEEFRSRLLEVLEPQPFDLEAKVQQARESIRGLIEQRSEEAQLHISQEFLWLQYQMDMKRIQEGV